MAPGRLHDFHLLNSTVAVERVQLSFVTATTNNVSVNVDFASWVKLKDNSFYVLGNPSVVSGITQYNEGSYTSALNADGSTAVYTIYNELGVYGGTLEAAYSDFLAGRRGSAPVPKRCAGAKRLFTVYGVPVPTGKCDTGVDFLYAGATVFQAGGWSWKSIPGGVANSLTTYMLGYNSVFYNGVSAPIVGGTHVYVNELPYD